MGDILLFISHCKMLNNKNNENARVKCRMKKVMKTIKAEIKYLTLLSD